MCSGSIPAAREVPALDADVVVRAVAAEDGTAGVLLDGGPAVVGNLLPIRLMVFRGIRSCRVSAKSLIIASRTLTTTPSPIDAALPVI